MIIGSISENKDLEKRISLVPDIIKKYTNLGLEVNIVKGYGDHLGFNDDTFKNAGAKILLSKEEVIKNSNILIQLDLINENDFFRKIISEIDIDRNKNIVIHPVISKQKIIFGYPDMLEEKFQKISLFYNDIVSAKGWNTYKSVNVKFKNQIICDKFS